MSATCGFINTKKIIDKTEIICYYFNINEMGLFMKKSIEKIKELIKKFCTKEVILYAIFGVLTTIVNWGTFAFLTKVFVNLDKNIANAIAIIVAVLVAYITNKDLVFHSEAKGFNEKFKEFWKFIAGRALTMLLEFGLDALLFLIPAVNSSSLWQMIVKMFVTVIVIILNFFISKFFAFKKSK